MRPALISCRLRRKAGDLILLVADQAQSRQRVLGTLRLVFRDRLRLADKDVMAFAWIVDFPMFAWDEERKDGMPSIIRSRCPSSRTCPSSTRIPGSILSDAYDMVCNGYELASGSIRIHRSDIQRKVFQLLGLGEEEIERQVRPHAGGF